MCFFLSLNICLSKIPKFQRSIYNFSLTTHTKLYEKHKKICIT